MEHLLLLLMLYGTPAVKDTQQVVPQDQMKATDNMPPYIGPAPTEPPKSMDFGPCKYC
jgi:hypothetical protein